MITKSSNSSNSTINEHATLGKVVSLNRPNPFFLRHMRCMCRSNYLTLSMLQSTDIGSLTAGSAQCEAHPENCLKVPAGHLIRHVLQSIALFDAWGSLVQAGAGPRTLDAVAAVTAQVPLPHRCIAQVPCNGSFWVRRTAARSVEGHDTVHNQIARIGQKWRIGTTFERPVRRANGNGASPKWPATSIGFIRLIYSLLRTR